MDDLDRDILREKERDKKRRKFEAAGFEIHVCMICGEDNLFCLELDHPPGHKHADVVVLVCSNHHSRKSAIDREAPSLSADPRDPLEIIGRWLLAMAAYFELLIETLRHWGEYLINRAKGEDDYEFNPL